MTKAIKMIDHIPTAEDIEHAEAAIAPFVHRTPIFTSSLINEMMGAKLFFKCENLQKVGAFKMRGATYALTTLSKKERSKGVATHSSGNHAQALALAAKLHDVPAYIVMPQDAPKAKVAAVKNYGAEIIFCESTLKAREQTLEEVQEKTGAVFIPPFDDYRIIAGQATATKEFIEDTDGVRRLYVPVGGGGLISGACLANKYFGHHLIHPMEIVGAEPSGADDAYRSFLAGERIPMENPKTLADGLKATLGERNFPIILSHAKEIVTVTDREIVEAMRLIWQHMKIIVEPSGAVPFAAAIKQKDMLKNKKIGILLSGGNVDLESLPF